jgi:hypothetical protein
MVRRRMKVERKSDERQVKVKQALDESKMNVGQKSNGCLLQQLMMQRLAMRRSTTAMANNYNDQQRGERQHNKCSAIDRSGVLR